MKPADGIRSPCDFAHSVALLQNNQIDEIFTLYEQRVQGGLEDVSVNITLNFFDAAGNPSTPASFRYSVLQGEIPEPSPLILILLPGVMMIHRSLRGWPLPRDGETYGR
jgi:hypothetical protein